jgi:hypothetical protein
MAQDTQAVGHRDREAGIGLQHARLNGAHRQVEMGFARGRPVLTEDDAGDGQVEGTDAVECDDGDAVTPLRDVSAHGPILSKIVIRATFAMASRPEQ